MSRWTVVCLVLTLAVPVSAQAAQGRADDSDSGQRSAADEAPIDPAAEEAFYVGNGLLADGNPADALASYDQALAIDSRLYRVHLYRARAFLLLNDHKRAGEAADVFASHAHSEEDQRALAEVLEQIVATEPQDMSREEAPGEGADAASSDDEEPAQATSGMLLPPPPKKLGPVLLVSGGVSMVIGIAMQIGGFNALLMNPCCSDPGVFHAGGSLIAVGIGLLGAGVPITLAARVPPPPALALAVEPGFKGGALLLSGRW